MQTLGTLFGCIVLLLASARVVAEDTGRLLWTADLSPFSYGSRPNPNNIGGTPYVDGKFADMGVIFKSLDEAFCYFVTKPTSGQLEQRGKLETTGPFQLQLVSFVAQTGTLKYRKELPARAGVTSVIVNSEGRLVVRTGDFLRLYSTDFATYSERLLPSAWLRGWEVRASPTGKTLGLRYSSYPLERFELLDSKSLSMVGSPQSDHLLPFFSISDSGIVQPDRERKNLLVRDFGGEWRTRPKSNSLTCISNNPVLINDNQLLNACGRDVVLLSTGGDVLMRDVVDKDEQLEELVSVTPEGKFLAVSAMQTEGGFMDYARIKRSRTRILVYDTSLRKRIASVRVDPIPRKDYDFALAPDGTKLIVMIDNRLVVYAIDLQTKLPATDATNPRAGNRH